MRRLCSVRSRDYPCSHLVSRLLDLVWRESELSWLLGFTSIELLHHRLPSAAIDIGPRERLVFRQDILLQQPPTEKLLCVEVVKVCSASRRATFKRRRCRKQVPVARKVEASSPPHCVKHRPQISSPHRLSGICGERAMDVGICFIDLCAILRWNRDARSPLSKGRFCRSEERVTSLPCPSAPALV